MACSIGSAGSSSRTSNDMISKAGESREDAHAADRGYERSAHRIQEGGGQRHRPTRSSSNASSCSSGRRPRTGRNRAVLAVGEGKDELAKRALVRKQELGEYVASYQDQWQAQRDSVEQLKGSLRDLTQKIEEAQRKKNHPDRPCQTGRGAAAYPVHPEHIPRIPPRSRRSTAWPRRWTRSKRRRMRNVRSTRSTPATRRLESEFKQLEKGDTSADRLLEDLKKKMGQIEDKSSESASQGTSGG